jgi:WD40 repeat protein
MKLMHRARVSRALLCASLAAVAASAALAKPPTRLWQKGGHIGINEVAIAPNLKLVATVGMDDETIKLWNTADGAFLRTIPAGYAGLQAIAFSHDGRLLATAADTAFGANEQNVKLWSVSDGTLVRGFGAPDSIISWSVDFSPDDSILAVAQGSSVKLYQTSTGTLLRTMTGHTFSVFEVRFSPDGTMVASASGDNRTKIWRVSDGALLKTLIGHTFFVNGLAWSPDGTRIATASWDMSVKIWNVATGGLVRTLTGHTDAVTSVSWSPDGLVLASGSTDSTLKQWDPATGILIRTLSDPDVLYVQSIRYASDGQTIVSGGSDSKARRWRASDGALLTTYGVHTDRVNSVDFSSDGRLVTGSGDTTAKIWSTADGTLLHDLLDHEDVINSVDVSPDDATLATAAGAGGFDTVDPTVKLWRMSDGALLRTLPGHELGSFSVSFSSDSLLVATGGEEEGGGAVKIWNAATGALVRTMPQTNAVTAVTWSSDGTVIVSGSGIVLTYWNATNGAKIREVNATQNQIVAFSRSPDGLTFAAADEGLTNNVTQWRYSDGGLVRTYAGHTNAAQGVAFSPEGSTLVSGSGFDREIRIWRVSDGQELAVFDQECGWGQRPKLPVAVSPDGALFGYGRSDSSLAVAHHPFGPDGGLVVEKNDSAGTVLLDWAGGSSPFTLRRATDAQFTSGVTVLVNEQAIQSFDDPVLFDGQLWFYRVE